MKIVGLDVSTSVVGVAVLEDDKHVPSGARILLLDHVEFKKAKTLWEKADVLVEYFDKLFSEPTSPVYKLDKDNVRVYVEESLQAFRPGFSSAATICTLAKFNGLASFFVRRASGVDPTYVAATTARKTVGVKVVKKELAGGKNAKEQTFDWCMMGPLKTQRWPTKRNGLAKGWVSDVTDAYVVALAGLILELRKGTHAVQMTDD